MLEEEDDGDEEEGAVWRTGCSAGLWGFACVCWGRLVPVLPRRGGADVTAGHEGPEALSAEPVTRFPSPGGRGLRSQIRSPDPAPEPAPAARPNLLSSSSSSSTGNASARSVNTRSAER